MSARSRSSRLGVMLGSVLLLCALMPMAATHTIEEVTFASTSRSPIPMPSCRSRGSGRMDTRPMPASSRA